MAGIEVTVRDLETGDEESRTIENDYVLVVAGDHYLNHTQKHPTTGTVVLTIKRKERGDDE